MLGCFKIYVKKLSLVGSVIQKGMPPQCDVETILSSRLRHDGHRLACRNVIT